MRNNRQIRLFQYTLRNAKGFSLMEMVAVIVLIAIALTAVSMSFSKNIESAKVRAASRDLVAALRYTRGQAIVKGQQEILELNLQDNTYQAPRKSVTQLPKNMTLRLTTAAQEQTDEGSGRIRFFPDGSSTGGHISILLEQQEWRINVGWLTGEVTLDQPSES